MKTESDPMEILLLQGIWNDITVYHYFIQVCKTNI
jgi:hypothetical protein